MKKHPREIAQELLPQSTNWEWSFKELEYANGMELRGVYKGDQKAQIRTLISIGCLLNNRAKAIDYINTTVKKAEDHVEIMESPLFKAMREE